MTFDEMLTAGKNYFEEHEDEFIEAIEALDDYNGYLQEDRCYAMCLLDDFFGEMKLHNFLNSLCDTFNPNDKFFIDGIYGVESTDERDYSYYLDTWFIQSLYKNRADTQIQLALPDVIKGLFESYDKEVA